MDNRTTGTETRPPRTLDRPLAVIDPRAAAELLMNEPGWQRDEKASVTLEHTGPMRVVLTCLHGDATMGADVNDDWVCIDVVDGEVDVERAGERVRVTQGQRVVLSPDAGWALTALADPTLLLSTFSPDSTGG
ncbi:MAG: hypothetical protein QOH61_2688 [Chloroflexota bacterium]|jgi:hypothetical protein|nr:hypothetical protein [Chloroflexota bacterium]